MTVCSRRKAAFTLVELLVVVGILAVLAALTLTAVTGSLEKARRADCVSRLRQVYLAFQMYVINNRSTYPWAEDPVSLDPYYWLWMGRGWRQAVCPYIEGKLDVLYCPSDETAPQKWESTSYGYSMAFYHSPAQIDQMRGPADTYQNPQPAAPQRTSSVAHPTRKVMVAEWLSNHCRVKDDKGWWCWQGARNCLFADGHVEYREATSILPANDGWPDFNLTSGGIRGKDVE